MGLTEIQARSINGGLVTGLPPFQIGVAESPDCQNVDPSDPRGAVSRKGSSLYFDAASAGSGVVGRGLFPWFRNLGTAYFFVAHGTTIWSIDGASAFNVLTGLATDSIMQAAPLNNMLVVVGSGLWPKISTAGSTLASITAGTYLPSTAKYACAFVSRVWTSGNPTEPNTIYSCKTNDPEDWTTANNAASIKVGDGDGDTIHALVGTKRAMYILKRNNAYALIGDSPFNYEVLRIRQIGLVSDWGACTDGEGCFFASDDGIYYVSGVNVARISDGVKTTYKDISDKTTVALEIRGSKLFCFYKSSGASQNDTALVCDVSRKMPDGEVRGIWSRYTAHPYQVVKTAKDNALYALTNASTIQLYKLDTGNVGSVPCYWNSPDLDFGDPYVVKTLARFFLHVAPPATATTFQVQFFGNGASVGSQYSVSVGITGSYSMIQAAPRSADTITGNYLRMKIIWTGSQTIYGWKQYADIRAAGDIPRR